MNKDYHNKFAPDIWYHLLHFDILHSYLKMDINFPVFAKPSDENIQT